MIDIIKNLFSRLFDLLPDSPFQSFFGIDSEVRQYLAYLNWVIPFDLFKDITLAWVGCILAYYVFVFVKKLVIDVVIGKIIA